MSLEYLPVGDMTKLDLEMLDEARKADPRGWSLESVVDDIEEGNLQCWRFLRPPHVGLILTYVQDTPRGRELFVQGVAGRGMALFMESLQGKIEEIARGYECQWIRAHVTNVRLIRPYIKRLGYEVEAFVVRKGV